MAKAPQTFYLRWSSHTKNIIELLSEQLFHENLVDVTLACEGKFIKAHKVVLSSCSPYFHALFQTHAVSNPVVILNNARFVDLKNIIDFMYKGQIKVADYEVTNLITLAKNLQIKGLSKIEYKKDQGVVPREQPKKRKQHILFQKHPSKKINIEGSGEISTVKITNVQSLRKTDDEETISDNEEIENTDTAAVTQFEEVAAGSTEIKVEPPDGVEIEDEDTLNENIYNVSCPIKDEADDSVTELQDNEDTSASGKPMLVVGAEAEPPAGAFSEFVKEWRDEMQASHPSETEKEITCRLKSAWYKMPQDRKSSYLQQAAGRSSDINERCLNIANRMKFVKMPPRKTWDPDATVKAVIAVRDKEMGYRAVAKAYSVPRTTLKNYAKSDLTPEKCVTSKFGRKPVFTAELEKSLVEYCLDMEQHYYGLTISDLRRLAYQLAIKNQVPYPFSSEAKVAGKKWVRLFVKRHPDLSLRRPQNLSMARAKGFTKEYVEKYFSILKTELEKINFEPSKIFNVDETGITMVQHKATRVVTCKGKNQVHKLSSAESGATTTVITCMSAAGQYIPPLLIFPKERWQEELLDGAPPGSIGGCSDSGWVTGPLFLKWFEHFISTVKPSKEKPAVLILDGHYSHTRNLEFIDRAKEAGVSIICLPPHSTDKLQPLDVAFMFPLKTRYAKAIEQWLASNPNRIVTKLQVSSLFCEAYLCAATLETAVNGFRKTGIHPFNPDVFQEHNFIARQFEEPEVPDNGKNNDNQNVPAPVTGSSNKTYVKASKEKKEIAKARQKKQTQSKAKKRLIFEEKDQPGTSSTKPPKKKTKKYDSSSSDSGDETQVLLVSTDDEDSSSDSGDETQVLLVSTDDEDSSSDEDAPCPICGERFSQDKRGEKWIKCSKCFKWCHEICSSSTEVQNFVCNFCLDG